MADLNTDLQISPDAVQTSKLLGVVLDSNPYFADMINNTCRVCFFKLSKLQSIRHSSFDTKNMLVKSFIISCLDYCNILYSCATKNLLNKLKKVLNACVRFVFNIPSYSHTSLLPYLQQCHILPIEFRIKYKLSFLCSKS